jgi:hypothetical protein
VVVRYCHGQTDATRRIALPSIHSVQRLGSEQDRSTTITESPPKTSPCQAPSTGHFGVWFCSGCSSCSCSRSCSCSCSIDHGIVPFRLGGCTGSIRVCNAMDERERNHGLRDEPINLVVRVEDRKDAMPSNRSITSTSTVRDSGLSTSTMGSCGRVGQNSADHSRTITLPKQRLHAPPAGPVAIDADAPPHGPPCCRAFLPRFLGSTS